MLYGENADFKSCGGGWNMRVGVYDLKFCDQGKSFWEENTWTKALYT